MEEQLISLETAKLAKEKGFDWKCRGRIHCSHFHFVKKNIIPKNVPTNEYETFACIEDWNNLKHQDPNDKNGTLTGLYLSLPTQSLLQKWLREKHNILALVDLYNSKHWQMVVGFYNGDGEIIADEVNYLTYEEALEKSLFKALKLIK